MSELWATLTNQAESAARGGRYAEAKDCYRQALADADSRRDPNNAYYTRCNLAGLLRLLDEYEEAEKLLREATHLRHTHPEQLAREPISPLTDLERILVKQNRLAELEILLSNDAEKMFNVYGRDSFECKMSLMNLGKVYGTQFKDMDKCRAIFREVLDWAKMSAEPITRKMIFNTYDGVLRGAGLTAEADAAQEELAAVPKQSPA